MDKFGNLKSIAAKLQDHHFQWIVNAALDHFQNSVKDTENEILRHEHFAKEVFFDYRTLNDTRAEKVERARRDLEEKRNIVAFLRALSEVLSDFSSERFAQEVVVMFKNKRT
jgi:hypothetical protein